MATRIQLRRGTTANWSSSNPTLAEGEIGIETDSNKLKIGNGTQSWNNLSYGGLQGIQGTTGTQGITGTQGTTGSQGTQGTQGVQGTQGIQGGFAFGLGTGVQGFLTTPTSANLATALTDETGTGAVVFGTGPTISNLTLTGTLTAGAAAGTSGQVLSSTGSGVQWSTPAAGAAFSEFMLIGA